MVGHCTPLLSRSEIDMPSRGFTYELILSIITWSIPPPINTDIKAILCEIMKRIQKYLNSINPVVQCFSSHYPI